MNSINLGLKAPRRQMNTLARKRSRLARKNKKRRMNRIQAKVRIILRSMRLPAKVPIRMKLIALRLRIRKREIRRK